MLNTDAAQPAGRIATVHGHYTIAGEGYWRQKASKIGRRQGGQAGTPPRSPVRGRSWAAMGTRNWEHERRTHHSGSNRGGMPARRTRLRAGPTGHWRPGRAECDSTRGPCWPCEGRLGGARVIPQYRMMPQGRVRLIPARDGRRRDSVCREGEVNWAAAGHTARVSFGPLPQSTKQAA